jgi:hypothetical protein
MSVELNLLHPRTVSQVAGIRYLGSHTRCFHVALGMAVACIVNVIMVPISSGSDQVFRCEQPRRT